MGTVIELRKRRPTGLSAEARRLWNEVTADYEVADSAGLAVLRQLCETLDHLRSCQAKIVEDGLMIRGSRGQKRPHPLLREVTEAKRHFLACVRSLNLDLAPPE